MARRIWLDALLEWERPHAKHGHRQGDRGIYRRARSNITVALIAYIEDRADVRRK